MKGKVYIIQFVLFQLLINFPLNDNAYAEYALKPQIYVSQEYDDNILQTDVDNKSEYITRVQPGLLLNHESAIGKTDISYTFDYRHYARGLRDDETTHNLTASASYNVIHNILFLDVKDNYRRVSLDVSRTTTSDSLFVNQTDQNDALISPYFFVRPSSSVNVKAGYSYRDIWYSDSRSPWKHIHTVFGDISHEVTSKLFMNSGYKFSRDDSEINRSFSHEAYVGPRYEYAEKSYISAQGGLTWTDYDSRPDSTKPYWNVVLNHTFDTVTAILSSSVKYVDDPLGGMVRENSYASLSIQENFAKGSVTMSSSYSELYDMFQQTRTTEKTTAGMNGNYEVSSNLRAMLGFTFENYRNLLLHATTKRYFVDTKLTYLFGHDLSVSVNYKYNNFESAQIATDNMQSNAVILEISKVFNQ